MPHTEFADSHVLHKQYAQRGNHLFLLQQMDLVLLHTKQVMLIQQCLCRRMRVITGHDDQLKLHWLLLILAGLVLQRQNAFNVYLSRRF